MALSPSIAWEVRTGGAATNGGGFKVGASGTDYSQQNAAQYTPTTTLTSAGAGAVILYAAAAADMVGNLINITAGTNFTTGWYEIISAVAGVSITTDRNSTTGVGANGTGNVGGAMSGPEDVDAIIVPGNICYIQAGTYTKTTTRTLTCDGTIAGGEIAFVGYTGARAAVNQDFDIIEASMPVFTSATNSIAIFTQNGANRVRFRNIKCTHTATTRGNGWTQVTNASTGIVWENCIADGCLRGWYSSGGVSWTTCTFDRLTIRNSTNSGMEFAVTCSDILLKNCISSANAGAGFNNNAVSVGVTFVNCISYANTGASGHGFWDQNTTTDISRPTRFVNCVAYGNAQSGFRFAYTTGGIRDLCFDNCLSYNNTVSEMSCATAGLLDGTTGLSAYPRVRNLAVKSGGGSSGERVNFRSGEGYIQLTADPFTNAAGGDFSLNSTAGGGALLRGLGYPTEIGAKGSSTTTYPNVGASSPQATSSGGVVIGG